MIRLRLGKRVPRNAANLAYVHSPGFSVGGNIALMDLSYTRPENIAAYGADRVVDITVPDLVDTQDIRLSSRSVLHAKVNVPKPLFYRYRIGRGTYDVLSNDATPGNLGVSREVIRKALVILDREDNVLRDLDWDINLVATDGTTGYTVDLYLGRRQRPDETFKVKYDAKSGSTILSNHIEVINAIEDMVQGTDYTLTQQSTGYLIGNLDAAVSYAPGVGLFYRGTGSNGTVTVTGTTLTLTDDALATYDITLTGKSVSDVVTEINELDLVEYWAVPLSPSTACRLVAGTFNVWSYGTEIDLDQIVHVRSNEEVRIQALRPYPDSTASPWYPRIDPGEFQVAGTISSSAVRFQYAVPEYANQTWSYTYGQPWRDMSQDLPEIIGDKMLQVHRRSIKDGSLTLYLKDRDVTSRIDDIDLLNGIIFLNQRFKGELTADYSYEEQAFVYTGIDLNTNSLHNPDLFGKYIGIYVTPYRILSSTPALRQTFSTCVRHVVRDTYAEVVSQVQGVLFDDASDPQAFLLGVYRPVLTAELDDVKIVDTRTRGGGITDEIKTTDEPESDFYWDIGNWDGQPFQDKGSLVVGVPEEIQGTGSPRLRLDIPVDPTGFVAPTGRLSWEFVQQMIDRHIAGGHMALIWPRTGAFSG
jgi:hypothetical protein